MELKMVSARISQKLERNNELKSEMSKFELEISQVRFSQYAVVVAKDGWDDWLV